MIRKNSLIICTLRVYFLLLIIAVSHPSFVISSLEIPKEQINDIERSKFQCKDGRYITKSFVCDGLQDCSDGSDETYNQCQNITCNEELFQCHYGACINKTYQCDGVEQCVDGSDELAELCHRTNQSPRKSRATENSKSCTIPQPSVDKTVRFLCADNTTLVCDSIKGSVPEHTTALIKCSPGYGKERKSDEEENNEYVCLNKKWLPKIDGCYKICDKLNPVNVDLRCFRNGISIPCDEDTVLLHGTIVRPYCKPTHKYSSGFPPDYSEIACNSEGKWDKTLFSCIPECGISYTNPKPLIKGGRNETFGDSPWHVAIYSNKKILICGGTIITPHLVVSAAHCFHEERSSSKAISNADDYEVVVGKVTRNYDVKDNAFQKIHKIKYIHFSSKGFFGAVNGYQADIALLVLKEKLNISSAVLPACIDWVALRDGIYPPEDTLGKVVGWGKDGSGIYSDTLATVNLPFLSHQRCLETVPEDFKPFITFDKFCAGSENGASVLEGDSGGGLLFKKNNRYFLQGIVSIKQPTLTGIAAFTDIAEHARWILKVREEVEELNRNLNGFQTTTKATTSPDSVKFAENSGTNRPPATTDSPSSTVKMQSSKSSASIALENCKKYAEYRSVQKWKPPIANRPGYWQITTDCVNVLPLIAEGIQTKPKEYPHMALIGFGDDITEVEYLCSGSLISEKFILGLASCPRSFHGPAQLALLGDLDIETEKDEAKPAVYGIKKVYKHPEFNPEKKLHDITLYELNTTVRMSPFVRPACLHTSSSISINTTASIVGWLCPARQDSNHLLKGKVSIVDPKQCIESSGYNNVSDTMVCAWDFTKGRDKCETPRTNRPPATTASPNSTEKPPSSKSSASIALEYCKKYTEYLKVKKWQPAMANRAGYWDNITDCVNVVLLIAGGTETKPKEYPHMALLGNGDKFQTDSDYCSGSLISEKFILGSASCSIESLDPVRWVLLGDLDLKSEKDDAKPAYYEIKKVYHYPEFNGSTLHNIALYELNTTVEMSPYVRPACLHTSTSIPINTKASIAGWGYDHPDGQKSDHLLKATISVLDLEKCKAANPDPVTEICAGDLLNRRDTCPGDYGVPLQIPKNKQTCMWEIVGIASNPNFYCGTGLYPGTYINVAHYLTWIQKIVWPQ